jgi:peptidoglycan/LPS O-acetylase OafA/YrhL
VNEPWFDANSYAWIPGTVLGLLGGLWGTFLGLLAPKGKGRRLVYGILAALLLASGALLVAGAFAWSSGQPYGIWFALGLPGLVGLIVLGCNAPTVTIVYRQAEERRMAARDL